MTHLQDKKLPATSRTNKVVTMGMDMDAAVKTTKLDGIKYVNLW